MKNAFLHGELDMTVYSQQPSGFVGADRPTHVCQLRKSLYGLRQAPRAWFQRFHTFILSLGFHASKCDSSLFILQSSAGITYLLLYIDDILLTASSAHLLRSIIAALHAEFAMSDLGDLHHFLGITAHRTTTGLFLS